MLSGSWTGSLSNYTGTVLGQQQHGLTTEWVRISTNVTVTDPSTSCFQVRVSGAVGQVWVDDFFVGKSQDRARHVAAAAKSDDTDTDGQPPPPEVSREAKYSVENSFNVTYAQGLICPAGATAAADCAATDLKLDVYAPAFVSSSGGRAAQPAYILAHGGGWVGGQKEQGAFQGSAEFFASRGFVAFNVRSLHVLGLPAVAVLLMESTAVRSTTGLPSRVAGTMQAVPATTSAPRRRVGPRWSQSTLRLVTSSERRYLLFSLCLAVKLRNVSPSQGRHPLRPRQRRAVRRRSDAHRRERRLRRGR